MPNRRKSCSRTGRSCAIWTRLSHGHIRQTEPIRGTRDFALPAVERGEEWHWTLRLQSSPSQMIGSVTLRNGENNNRGFWVGLPWQGKGFMTEACEAVTDYWFDVLKFPVLRAPKAVVNAASRRISEKTGMRVIAREEREYVSGRFLTEIWEITAEEWHARMRNQGRRDGVLD